MKKLFKSLIVGMLVVSCLSVNVAAADNLSYLDDGIEIYNYISPRLNYEPLPENVVFLPSQSGRFNYQFGIMSVQYSDFVISPQDSSTGIRIKYKGTSDDHTLYLEIRRKGANTLIIGKTLSVIEGVEQTTYIPSDYFTEDYGYYIKLTNPSIDNASGTFTITD